MNEEMNKPPEGGQPEPAAAPAKPPLDPEHQDIEDNRLMAALSYLGVLFLIPLLAASQSKYVRFHLRQGLILFVLDVIASFFNWCCPPVGILLTLVLVVISVYGFVMAYQKHHWKLPVFADLAKKIRL